MRGESAAGDRADRADRVSGGQRRSCGGRGGRVVEISFIHVENYDSLEIRSMNGMNGSRI